MGTALRESVAAGVLVAAVGPVTAAPLRDAGIEVLLPHRYRLGALIRLVAEQLSSHHIERYRSGEVIVELRGRSVTVDGRCVVLGPNALSILRILTRSQSVVSRHELMTGLPEPLDPHALEVAISRLRRSLDVPGLISTVVRRGYRFNAVRVTD
jgi:uroporphyrinogen-III synthase